MESQDLGTHNLLLVKEDTGEADQIPRRLVPSVLGSKLREMPWLSKNKVWSSAIFLFSPVIMQQTNPERVKSLVAGLSPYLDFVLD